MQWDESTSKPSVRLVVEVMIVKTLNKHLSVSVPGLRLPREESVLNVAPVLFLEIWLCAWPPWLLASSSCSSALSTSISSSTWSLPALLVTSSLMATASWGGTSRKTGRRSRWAKRHNSLHNSYLIVWVTDIMVPSYSTGLFRYPNSIGINRILRTLQVVGQIAGVCNEQIKIWLTSDFYLGVSVSFKHGKLLWTCSNTMHTLWHKCQPV